MSNNADHQLAGIRAQAHLHHAYLLGLQLMVATNQDNAVVGEWMFRLFRRQHEEKFLPSFEKLGLTTLPDAVACARYHVLSNNLGGVGVEYAEESERKAWVRFRYPRWMYHGPTICGVPLEVSRGFLKGWYGQNGVSLNNPRLGFVCVSEDMTGEFGLCGYFYEYDHELAPDERLKFAKDERPPNFADTPQPEVPLDRWTETRREKANRNYAMTYIRNGLAELAPAAGVDTARDLGQRAATLIGLQYYQDTAARVGVPDGALNDFAAYLKRMFEGMGDTVSIEPDGERLLLRQSGLRIIRDLPEPEAELLFHCWASLWDGTARAQQLLKRVDVVREGTTAYWLLGLA
ncbi:MAG: hypothetical protein AAF648_15725 [Pseudomonadota bacterium]